MSESETNVETKTENNIDQQEAVEKEKEGTAEPPAKRGRKAGSGSSASKKLSSLAKEAEAILKGFNDKDDVPEGRRTTRSSTRGSIVPVATPPPVKKERKSSDSASSGRTGRRGRPKRSESDDAIVDNEQKETETNNVTGNDVKTPEKSEENGSNNVDETNTAAATKTEDNAKDKMEVDGTESSTKADGSNDNEKELKSKNEDKPSSEIVSRTTVPESENNHCEQNDKSNDTTRTEETGKSASVVKSSPIKEIPAVKKNSTGESNSANGEEAKSANTNSSAVEVSKD